MMHTHTHSCAAHARTCVGARTCACTPADHAAAVEAAAVTSVIVEVTVVACCLVPHRQLHAVRVSQRHQLKPSSRILKFRSSDVCCCGLLSEG
eukprot:7170441-Alexandrium_andersonii.AAC.1